MLSAPQSGVSVVGPAFPFRCSASFLKASAMTGSEANAGSAANSEIMVERSGVFVSVLGVLLDVVVAVWTERGLAGFLELGVVAAVPSSISMITGCL
jgi:hypothetical protein